MTEGASAERAAKGPSTSDRHGRWTTCPGRARAARSRCRRTSACSRDRRRTVADVLPRRSRRRIRSCSVQSAERRKALDARLMAAHLAVHRDGVIRTTRLPASPTAVGLLARATSAATETRLRTVGTHGLEDRLLTCVGASRSLDVPQGPSRPQPAAPSCYARLQHRRRRKPWTSSSGGLIASRRQDPWSVAPGNADASIHAAPSAAPILASSAGSSRIVALARHAPSYRDRVMRPTLAALEPDRSSAHGGRSMRHLSRRSCPRPGLHLTARTFYAIVRPTNARARGTGPSAYSTSRERKRRYLDRADRAHPRLRTSPTWYDWTWPKRSTDRLSLGDVGDV